jgi:hypothetical protein
MPSELIVMNPRHKRRRRRRGAHRRRVSHVRKNPRRRMSALQRKYFGGGHRRRRHSRRRRVSYVRRNPTNGLVASAPVHRRRRSNGHASSPIDMLTETILPAGVGAAGALALDMLWGYLPLPASLMTGALAPVTRIAGAVGIGLLVGMVAGEDFGEEALSGAVTVTLYDLFKSNLQSVLPAAVQPAPGAAPLGVYVNRLGYYTSPAPYVGHRPGMGIYVN